MYIRCTYVPVPMKFIFISKILHIYYKIYIVYVYYLFLVTIYSWYINIGVLRFLIHNNFLWSRSSDDFLILCVCAACVRIKTPIHAFVEARVVVDCFPLSVSTFILS